MANWETITAKPQDSGWETASKDGWESVPTQRYIPQRDSSGKIYGYFDSKKNELTIPVFDDQTGELINPATLDKTPPKEDTPIQKVAGVAEAGLGFISGIPAQLVGTVVGIGKEVASGKMGTAEGERLAEKATEEFSSEYSYSPRTETGQAILEKAGDIMAPLAFLGPEATPHFVPTARYLATAAKVKLSDAQIAHEAGITGIPKDTVDEIIKPQQIKETAFKDKTTGKITKSGNRHNDSMKADPNQEQGFLDGNGNFLNRHDALTRAMSEGQLLQDQSLEFPDEGLHSGDLKLAGEQKQTLGQAADELVRTRVNSLLAASRFIRNTAKRMNDIIPKAEDREAISDAIDKGETEQLSPLHKEVADTIVSRFKEIGERALKMGIIDGLRENYISHIVDWSKVPKSEVARLKELILGNSIKNENITGKSRFGKERKYSTFDALQKAIENTGLSIKTKDASEIYKIYAHSMERAIANQKLIEGLKKLQTHDDEGIQWAIQKVSEKTRPPIGWKYLDHPQLRGYVVNPEVAPMLKFIFDNHEPGPIMRGATMLTQATKRMNVIGSFFHAKSLMEAMYGNYGILKSLKETGLMGYDKIAGTKHSAVNQALDQFHNGGLGDSADQWVRNGLSLEVPEDVTIGVIHQIGKTTDEIMNKLGVKTDRGAKTLGTIEKYSLGIFDKITWDYLHTGLKLSVAEKLLETARKNHPDVPEYYHRQQIARHINNSFGGQNWFDAATQSTSKLGREILMSSFSTEGRRYLQLLQFAPDWTVSTIKAFTSALPRSLDIKGGVKGIIKPSTQADFARRYQLRTALIYATLVNAIQMSLTGKSIVDNNDPTRLEFEDGTSMQLMKHATEPYHWITDFDKTFANKLGFIPRAMIMGLGGLQYASPTAPKLQDLSVAGRLGAVAEQTLPFQVSSGLQAPTGERLKRAVAGMLGFPIYGMTKQERKKTRSDLRKAQMAAIKKWKKEHNQ